MKFWKRGTLWSTAVVVCMTGLLLSAPQNQGKENPTIRLYNEGTVLLNQGKGEEALRKMREVLRRDPNFASAYNVIGLISLMKRDFATAEENFLKVVSLQPNFTDTYNYLGILYRETGRNELARESFLRVVSAPDYPTKENGYFNLALLALSEKKEEEGLAFVEKAIGQNDNFAPAYNLRGRLLEVKGNLDGARSDYMKALRLVPENPNFHYDLALYHFHRKELTEAKLYFDKAATLGRSNAALVELCKEYLKKIDDERKTKDSVAP